MKGKNKRKERKKIEKKKAREKKKKRKVIAGEKKKVITYLTKIIKRKERKSKIKRTKEIKEIKKRKKEIAKGRGAYIKTGISGLDELFGGGIVEGSSVLVSGTPHCGKKPLLMKLAHSFLKQSTPVIIVLTDYGANSWKQSMKNSGWWDEQYSDLFYIVDCYSQQYGSFSSDQHITYLAVPYVLSQISIEVSNFIDSIRALYKQKPIVIFHSISTLVENFGEITTFKFIQFLIGRLRSQGITSIFSIQSIQAIAKMVEGIVDYVVDIKDSRIKVSGLGATREWVEYKLTDKGLIINK